MIITHRKKEKEAISAAFYRGAAIIIINSVWAKSSTQEKLCDTQMMTSHWGMVEGTMSGRPKMNQDHAKKRHRPMVEDQLLAEQL